MCRKLKLTLLFLLFCTTLLAQTREMAVSGVFYPSDKETLSSSLSEILQNAKQFPQKNIRAIIVPHAGYIFSSDIASTAYASLHKKYKNIFILGSSHHASFDGASIYTKGNYKTPLGDVQINQTIVSMLMKNKRIFAYHPQAHKQEHTIEVQLPFLQTIYGNDLRIVPILIGTSNTKTIEAISNALRPYFNDANLFVISSDLSHFPSYEDANRIDKITLNAIERAKPLEFIQTLMKNENSHTKELATSACGWSSILTLMYLTQNDNYKYELLAYKNSGDTEYGDKKSVVGYSALRVYKENQKFFLNEQEKKELLDIAKLTLYEVTLGNTKPLIDEKAISSKLKQNLGAFVTLNKNNRLRGCIGTFEPNEPLYKVVVDMTIAAAQMDNRFTKVTADELKNIEIEISVLTPRERIHSLNEIVLGKHGIFLQKGAKSGTFLPQVATDMHWSVEEFVGYCAKDKAHIGYNGYKDAKLYIFETLIIK